jgi:hypothetical protein
VMQMWLRDLVPVENTGKMIAWYAALPIAQQNKITPAFRQRVTELRLAADNASTDGALLDPEWQDFEKSYSTNKPGDQSELDELKKLAAFYRHKQLKCSQRKDDAGASAALNQLKPLSDLIHDMELRAQKLGRDLGDLVPRKTLEAPARFIGYHLLRCCSAAQAELVNALTVRDPTLAPLLPAEIAARIEPILLNVFVLQPIVRAAEGLNSAAPPDWLVAALRAGASDVLDDIQLDRTTAPAVPGAA